MTRFKHLAPTFAKHAVSLDERGTHPKLKKKRPAPVSLRLNEAELAALRKAASGRSMNGYIRERLFGDGAAISVSQPVSEDYEALARVLGALGKTDIYTTWPQYPWLLKSGACWPAQKPRQPSLRLAIRSQRCVLTC